MTLPIIILNYNSSGDCRKCIGYLKRQTGVQTEIIVVDNCSPRPGEQEAVRQLCEAEGCTFIQAPKNRGYNAGNNIGLRYAAERGYAYALIANPDMEFPQTDYLARMVQAMEEHPEAAVVASDIVGDAGEHQNPMRREDRLSRSFKWFRDFFIDPIFNPNKTADTPLDYAHSHHCDIVSGCCLMVRMSYIQSIGYFDEGVFLYWEEAILCRQVERDGQKMFYLAEAQAVHRHIESMKGNPVPRYEAWLKSRKYFIRNYNSESTLCKCLEILSAHTYVILLKLNHRINHHKA